VDQLLCYAGNSEHGHYRPLFRKEIAGGLAAGQVQHQPQDAA
jgi:hypothetical protein